MRLSAFAIFLFSVFASSFFSIEGFCSHENVSGHHPANELGGYPLKLVHVFKLASDSVHTGHPQSISITQDALALSYQSSPGAINFYKLKRGADGLISGVFFDKTLELFGGSHAGGIGRTGDRATLYVPLADKPLDPSKILKIENGHVSAIAYYPIHLGALFLDGTLLHAIGTNPGERSQHYGNSIYSLDLITGKHTSVFNPQNKDAFQDCKLFSEHRFLCSNKAGSNFRTLHGSVDLIEVAVDGRYKTISHLPVPHVNLDGSFAGDYGTYIPGHYGTPPLSYNGFDFERINGATYFYFVPNDDPDTRLYIYRYTK